MTQYIDNDTVRTKKYIDKTVIAAELEKRMQELHPTNTHQMQVGEKMDRDVLMWLNALTWVKKILNTLDVKEIGTIGENIIYETVNKEWPIDRNEKFIEMDFDNELKTESGVYVCVDANTKIYYKGDLPHCYLYSKMFRRQNGWELELLSWEKYNEMMETIKKI